MVRAAAKNHQFVAVIVDPADYSVVLDELRADGSISAATKRRLARDAFAADRRVRRPDRNVVRRRPAARDHAPVDDQGAVVAVRREPSSVRGALPRRGSAQLVGRCRPTRWQGDELPQPVRHRGGVAFGAAVRWPGVRDREARQPVRRCGQRRHHRRLRQGQCLRSGQRVRRHRRPQSRRCRRRWPRLSPGCSRR